jgi:hypothetical protein
MAAGSSAAENAWHSAEALERIDSIAGVDLGATALKPWPPHEARAALLRRADAPEPIDSCLCEIDPGKSLSLQRYRFEQLIYVLAGRGATELRADGGERTSFEWRAGALFCVPAHASYRHFNGSGKDPVRFIALPSAPGAIRPPDTQCDGIGADAVYETTYLADAVNMPLLATGAHGAGGTLRVQLVKSSLICRITQLPPATYGKAHWRPTGAYTIVLAGEGYALLWPDDGARVRHAWRQGILLAHPRGHWCQYFNPCASFARFLTLTSSAACGRSTPYDRESSGHRAVRRIGYAQEAPDIRLAFADALAQRGMISRMQSVYAADSGGS